ncbi:methionyl-tRNA formyltransferase [Mycoplasmatota bacterium]|nr:methionyl-tRNA formyltransferase [Mycoplasmatota bacterium]
MKIVFMGTPEFSINVLQALIDSEHDVVGVVTQPDRFVGRKKILTPPPIKALALNYQIPVFQPEKIKEDYQQIILWKPDLIITCAYGQIIPKALLDFPPYKAINVHASLLPKYRGGAPIHQAIIDGCQKTGVTIMYMDVKMDEGDIISQEEVVIEKNDNVGTMHQKLSVVGAKLLMESLPSIFSGTNQRLKQNPHEATYASNIKPQDELIDWNNDGEAIYNQVRGLNPWPGAYTMLDHKRVKIYDCEVVQGKQHQSSGEIIQINKNTIIITTGNETCIKVNEVQLAGKKRQLMKDVLNGHHPFEIGKIFTLV